MKKILFTVLALGVFSQAFANTPITVNVYMHTMAQSGDGSYGTSYSALQFQKQVINALKNKDLDVVSWKYSSLNSSEELRAQNFENAQSDKTITILCEDRPLIKIGGCGNSSDCQVGDGLRFINRSVTTIIDGKNVVKGKARWDHLNTSCEKATLEAISKL